MQIPSYITVELLVYVTKILCLTIVLGSAGQLITHMKGREPSCPGLPLRQGKLGNCIGPHKDFKFYKSPVIRASTLEIAYVSA